ncbi:hypothetical protein [Amycolatopsis sp. NPDC004378]
MTGASERADLIDALRSAERLVGDVIAGYLAQCESRIDPVSVEGARLAGQNVAVALELAVRLQKIATAVEETRPGG